MSSMRTSTILAAIAEDSRQLNAASKEKTQVIDLSHLFIHYYDKVDDKENGFVYRAGTPLEAVLWGDHPTTAEEHYDLALSFLKHEVSFFNLPMLSEGMKFRLFALSLLIDAATAGYKPATELLISILQKGKYDLNAADVGHLLKLKGYRLIKNKDSHSQLDFWASTAPQSIADLRYFMKTLNEEGPVSQDYILVQPKSLPVLASKISQQLMNLRQSLKEEIHHYFNTLVSLAKAEKTEELRTAANSVLKAAEEGLNPFELRLLKKNIQALYHMKKPQEAPQPAPDSTPLQTIAVENTTSSCKKPASSTFFQKPENKPEVEADKESSDELEREMNKENDKTISQLIMAFAN